MPPLDNIDRFLGLHQHLEIHYLVDCYEAVLLNDDGVSPVASATGETIEQSLLNLDIALDGKGN